jgi:hypothetical protein
MLTNFAKRIARRPATETSSHSQSLACSLVTNVNNCEHCIDIADAKMKPHWDIKTFDKRASHIEVQLLF